MLLGGGVALDGACSPNDGNGQDASADAPVCDPDSGDPAGCACDPNKDKTSPCYTGPLGTQGKGPCKVGTRSCVNGKFTACEGEVTPQPEVCDYADNDCNGLVDDLPEIVDAAVLARCNSPACDQANMGDAAITCWGPDPGICGAGVKTCASGPNGGTPNGCTEYLHAPAQEVCNGVDDDCNGLIDDGLNQEGPCDMPDGSMWPDDANPFEGGTPKQVLGECLHGQLTCVATGCTEHSCADAGDQCMPAQPVTEKCDMKDNDCNGKVDDHACPNNTYCCQDLSYPQYSFCTNYYEGDGGVGQYYNCVPGK